MKKTNATSQPNVDSAFLALLQQHRKGEILSDLAESMRRVTQAVQESGRAGYLTLRIDIRPASKGRAGALVVEDEIKEKLPSEDKAGSIFFADKSFNLTREDPNQQTLELRSVEGASTEQQPQPLKKAQEA